MANNPGRAWALLAAATLGGCVRLGPDFQSPRQDWIDHWDSQALDIASQQHPQPDRRQWWAQFEDPLLDRLISAADSNNSSLRIAALRILEARAQLGIASSGRYPQVQQGSAELEPCLREFEFALLTELGQPIDWQQDADGNPLEAALCYQWQHEQGFVVAANGFKAQHLLNIGKGQWQSADTRRCAKQLSRQILAPLLGSKPLASRALFEGG